MLMCKLKLSFRHVHTHRRIDRDSRKWANTYHVGCFCGKKKKKKEKKTRIQNEFSLIRSLSVLLKNYTDCKGIVHSVDRKLSYNAMCLESRVIAWGIG